MEDIGSKLDLSNGVTLTGDLGVIDNFVLDKGVFTINDNKLTLGKPVATNNVRRSRAGEDSKTAFSFARVFKHSNTSVVD